MTTPKNTSPNTRHPTPDLREDLQCFASRVANLATLEHNATITPIACFTAIAGLWLQLVHLHAPDADHAPADHHTDDDHARP